MKDNNENHPSLSKSTLYERLMKGDHLEAGEQITIPKRHDSQPLSASFAQQRLWFLDQLGEPKSALYNIYKAWWLKGNLNLAALERALAEIVHRHESLRTTFAMQDGRLIQNILENPKFRVSFIDLIGQPEREMQAFNLAAAEAQAPFNLTTDMMLRATVIRLDSGNHLLLLVLHHIAADAWSFGILFRELATLYKSFSSGDPVTLAPLLIQYADFALWHREWLKSSKAEKQLSYWKKQLEGAPQVLNLPTDRPRPVIESHHGTKNTSTLPTRLCESLKTFSRREGVTLFMTLLAAFQALLARYTGQEDIVVGTPIAGRNRVETEDLIGFFVNTLALRTDLTGDPTFRELLGRVKATALGAYSNQDLPFEKLVEELQPERHLSYSPIFQTLLVLQNVPRTNPSLSGLEMEPINLPCMTAQFDLTLSIFEESEGLKCIAEYCTDLFDEATIKRMLSHFEVLLEGIVTDPERRLSQLPLLSEGERQRLLIEWNETSVPYSLDNCVHELIEAQSERTPDQIAVEFEGEKLSYRELNLRSNQLAHYLREAGVDSNSLIGIFLDRSLSMIVALLGVLKAGAAYIPLDPSYPTERLNFMLADAGVKVLLTEKTLREKLPNNAAFIIYLDRERQNIGRQPTSRLARHATSENLAYVIYTSGSTGTPKGVQITHGALLNLLHSMLEAPGMTEDDTLLAVSTISFDIAGLEIYLSLIAGARLYLVSREVASDGVKLSEKIARASIMQATPATWNMLLDAGWQGTPGLKALCGGEALPRNLADRLLDRCAALWNLYGPTETTIWSTRQRIFKGRNAITIGRPIANTKTFVLDSHLNPVPVGVPGELYIGGAGLARGYLNRPQLTAERFIPNPFEADPTTRLYKTGDLVRYLPDGQLIHLGRLDNQVKIRGYRVELGEIEMALTQHNSVREAVVTIKESQSDDKMLVAHVVARDGHRIYANELQSFLSHKLPSYMIPAIFIELEELPLTTSGKVDRIKLAAAEPRLPRRNSYLAPRHALEFRLVNIWEQVLGRAPIGVRDNFFELGGHSLLAVRLFARIEKELGRRLPLATLFQGSTVEYLANVLENQHCAPSWSSLVPIQPAGFKAPFYCVHDISGQVLNFYPLARNLGDEQPFYGLQTQGLDGRRAVLLSVNEIAAHYVKEILTIQPEGPYFIGGASFGGLVAFEMARQFRAQGHELGLVALFDIFPHGYDKTFPQKTALEASVNHQSMRERASHHLSNLQSGGMKGSLRYIRKRTGAVAKRYKSKAWRQLYKIYEVSGRELPPSLRNIREANLYALSTYVPQPYLGKVVLFQAQDDATTQTKMLQAKWGDFALAGLEVRSVPGGHVSMLKEPNVKVLAEALRGYLDQTMPPSR